MSRTAQVRWGLLRPGTTVVGDMDTTDRKVVAVDHRGTTVSVLFWDGTRELHGEDAFTRVRLTHASRRVRSRP